MLEIMQSVDLALHSSVPSSPLSQLVQVCLLSTLNRHKLIPTKGHRFKWHLLAADITALNASSCHLHRRAPTHLHFHHRLLLLVHLCLLPSPRQRGRTVRVINLRVSIKKLSCVFLSTSSGVVCCGCKAVFESPRIHGKRREKVIGLRSRATLMM